MEKPYAVVGENGVQYSGPPLAEEKGETLRIGIFGPRADEIIQSAPVVNLIRDRKAKGQTISLIAIPSQLSWGRASDELVKAVYQDHVLALIALDRESSHLAEQIAVKSFIPAVAISSDRALTSTNIPWIFRLPEGTPVDQALKSVAEAIKSAGANREKIRNVLASGKAVGGASFESIGELR
jgi:ABC-type branched-subunit amino acid transport system substrate-binding protein